MTILVINNFLIFKLVSKLVTIVTNNFWSLELVTNETFSCSVYLQFLLYLILFLLILKQSDGKGS